MHRVEATIILLALMFYLAAELGWGGGRRGDPDHNPVGDGYH